MFQWIGIWNANPILNTLSTNVNLTNIYGGVGDADGFFSLLMNKIVDHKSSYCLCRQVTDKEDHTQVWNCRTRYEVIKNA